MLNDHTYFQTDNGILYQGHVLDVLKKMPEKSVDCIFTSTPYFGLRNYKTESQIWDNDVDCEHEWEDNFCKKCSAWMGELGQEPSVSLFVKHLCDIFEESKRVLKDRGSLWVNLGDSYNGSGGEHLPHHKNDAGFQGERLVGCQRRNIVNIPKKSLTLVPERFAIEMINRGWTLRQNIIWYKNNAMPESVKDRDTRCTENIYHFTKQTEYYYEQQLEPLSDVTIKDIEKRKNMLRSTGEKGSKNIHNEDSPYHSAIAGRSRLEFANVESGKNARGVWKVNLKSECSYAHFATFPTELVRKVINRACPDRVCPVCGKDVMKLYLTKSVATRPGTKSKDVDGEFGSNRQKFMPIFLGFEEKKCDCGYAFEPGIIMDIFMGSGTVGVVAEEMQRKWVGIELNPEYCKIAVKRINKQCQEISLF